MKIKKMEEKFIQYYDYLGYRVRLYPVKKTENGSKTHTNRIQDHWVLRYELCSFFQEYSLDKSLLNNYQKWLKFSNSLFTILIDTPLVPKNNNFSFIFLETPKVEGFDYSCRFEIEYKSKLTKGSYSIATPLNEVNWLTDESVCC